MLYLQISVPASERRTAAIDVAIPGRVGKSPIAVATTTTYGDDRTPVVIRPLVLPDPKNGHEDEFPDETAEEDTDGLADLEHGFVPGSYREMVDIIKSGIVAGLKGRMVVVEPIRTAS